MQGVARGQEKKYGRWREVKEGEKRSNQSDYDSVESLGLVKMPPCVSAPDPTKRTRCGPALPLSKEEPPFRSSLKTSTKTAYLWYGVLTTGYCYARPRGCDRL